MAQLYLLFRAIFELFPITILPWGFYFIPFVLGKKNANSQVEDLQLDYDSSVFTKKGTMKILSVDDHSPISSLKNTEDIKGKLLSFQEKTNEDDQALSLN